ncbi:MAG: hypothetical protein AAF335_01125 [Bacteroidota bacterium]
MKKLVFFAIVIGVIASDSFVLVAEDFPKREDSTKKEDPAEEGDTAEEEDTAKKEDPAEEGDTAEEDAKMRKKRRVMYIIGSIVVTAISLTLYYFLKNCGRLHNKNKEVSKEIKEYKKWLDESSTVEKSNVNSKDFQEDFDKIFAKEKLQIPKEETNEWSAWVGEVNDTVVSEIAELFKKYSIDINKQYSNGPDKKNETDPFMLQYTRDIVKKRDRHLAGFIMSQLLYFLEAVQGPEVKKQIVNANFVYMLEFRYLSVAQAFLAHGVNPNEKFTGKIISSNKPKETKTGKQWANIFHIDIINHNGEWRGIAKREGGEEEKKEEKKMMSKRILSPQSIPLAS